MWLHSDDNGEIGATLARAKQLVPELARYADGARDCATEILFGDWHAGGWGEGEVLTPEQFKARIVLCAIHVYADGRVVFWQDGELFSDHSIVVSMDSDNRFEDASVHG